MNQEGRMKEESTPTPQREREDDALAFGTAMLPAID